MPSKWRNSIILTLGLLLLAGGALWVYRQAQLPAAGAPEAPQAATPTLPANSAVAPAEVQSFRAATPLKRVQEFYEQESQRVGRVDPDPALTQRRLALVAHELSPEEIGWLGTQALDTSLEGDARFFAAYILALSDQPQSIGALAGIALSRIPEAKEERRRAEERMIRGQAVEGIARNCGQPGARDALLDVVEKQSDEFLRDRAHRGLYSCATGKPLEEQDKAALRKMRGEKP
jgi:hypothetical protein